MTQAVSGADGTPRNALAVWALILGIAGLLLSLVIIGGLVGLVALVLGIVAVTRPGKKGMAITGIVTGGLSLPVAVVALPIWIAVLVVSPRLVGRVENARRAGTITEISNVKVALGIFETDVGRYPSTAEGLQALVTHPATIGGDWRGPYLEKFPVDKWGHEFIYLCPGLDDPTSFDLNSAGPNGIPGDDDDIQKNDVY